MLDSNRFRKSGYYFAHTIYLAINIRKLLSRNIAEIASNEELAF